MSFVLCWYRCFGSCAWLWIWFLQSAENFFRVCKKFSALCLYRTSRSNSHTHALGIRSWCRNAFKHIMCSMHTCMCMSWHGLRCQTWLTSLKSYETSWHDVSYMSMQSLLDMLHHVKNCSNLLQSHDVSLQWLVKVIQNVVNLLHNVVNFCDTFWQVCKHANWQLNLKFAKFGGPPRKTAKKREKSFYSEVVPVSSCMVHA